jgi:hypothetical protein
MMTTTMMDDPLMARAKALKLYGLLAHWEEVARSAWIEPLMQWEEQERARRSLQRRLGNAHLGRFRSLADFDWDWPKRCDREAIDELMGLAFLQEAANAILVGPNGVGKSAPSPATSHIRRCWPVTRCCVPAPDRCGASLPAPMGTTRCATASRCMRARGSC